MTLNLLLLFRMISSFSNNTRLKILLNDTGRRVLQIQQEEEIFMIWYQYLIVASCHSQVYNAYINNTSLQDQAIFQATKWS
jgi:hypothetical protein